MNQSPSLKEPDGRVLNGKIEVFWAFPPWNDEDVYSYVLLTSLLQITWRGTIYSLWSGTKASKGTWMKAMQCSTVHSFVVRGAVERESIDRWTIKPAPVTFAVDRAGPYVGQGSQLPSNPIHPSVSQSRASIRVPVSLSSPSKALSSQQLTVAY